MLYRVFIMLLMIAATAVTSCDDEEDMKTEPEPYRQAILTINGDRFLYYESCLHDFDPLFTATVHVADSLGNSLSGVNVKIIDFGYMMFLPANDSVYVTDDSGNVSLHFTSQWNGDFAITVVAEGDTATYEFQIHRDEGILGCRIGPARDTLYHSQGQPDSMEIRARLAYDLGYPNRNDSAKFFASSGYIDSAYHAFDPDGFGTISVYWYPSETALAGQIAIRAYTKTFCGQWPENVQESIRHDTTFFVYTPFP